MSNNNITTSPTSAPTNAPSSQDALACSNEMIPYYFYAQSGLTLILFLCVVAITMRMRKPPPPAPTNGKAAAAVVNYGRPWMIGLFTFSLCFWNSFTLTAMYIVFRFVLPTSILPYGQEIACVEISSFPYIPLFAIIQGWSVISTNHKTMVDELGAVINNSDDVYLLSSELGKDEPKKVLMMGGTGHGLFFVDALSIVQSAKTTMMFMDYPGIRNYIINNAIATKSVSPDEANELNILDPVSLLGCEKLGIPLEDNTVDKIVVCPGFRETEPIGGFMVDEAEKIPRMAFVFKEAIRVLKPGGTINIYDVAMDAVLAETDLRDLGCDGVEVSDTNARVVEDPESAGTAYYRVLWRKKQETSATPKVGSDGNCNASWDDDLYNQRGETQVAQVKSMEAELLFDAEDEGRPPRVRQSTRTVLMSGYQFFVFLLLVTLVTALYKETRIPFDLVGPYGAVSNFLLTIAKSYPMMAYVARVMMRCETQKKGRGHSLDDIKKVIIKNCRFDLKALLYSVAWGAFIWVIVFLFQLLMGGSNSSFPTDMSIVSILLGGGGMGYVFLLPRVKKRALSKLRNIPEEKWAMDVRTAPINQLR